MSHQESSGGDQRLLRAGWLKPCRQEPHRVLFDPHDVHSALKRMECSRCPPDRIEIARVRASELKNGHAYVPKEKPKPHLSEIQLDLSMLKGNGDDEMHDVYDDEDDMHDDIDTDLALY